MKYKHHFQVRAPLKAVADFHARSSSMAAITPPPAIVRVHQAPPLLSQGDEMVFTIWFGPLPIRWAAQIEDVVRPEDSAPEQDGHPGGRAALAGFADRQTRGPFAYWRHSHTFIPLDEATTAVVDEIELKFRPHPLWTLVGVGMWLSLPLLFAYRGWKTKQLLEK